MNANVAIKSNYRQYEISEKESIERNLCLSEFCVVDINLDIESFYNSEDYSYYQDFVESELSNVGFAQEWTLAQICKKLSNNATYGSQGGSGGSGGIILFSTQNGSNTNYVNVEYGKISVAGCVVESVDTDPFSENYGNTQEQAFIIPVAAFPFGNSVVLYFALDDNYSAGTTSKDITASYNEEQYIKYGNNFGRFDKLHIVYANKFSSSLNDTSLGKELYKWGNNTSLNLNDALAFFDNCIVSKDSREQISVTAQLNFVTPNSKIIIGPALPATLPLVGDFTTEYMYVVFQKKQNALADMFEGEVYRLNMPGIAYTNKTKHICIGENTADNYYNPNASSGGGIVPFIYVTTPTYNSPGEVVGEGYGIITTTGRICIYVEGIVHEHSVLPPIYLMFRRNI